VVDYALGPGRAVRAAYPAPGRAGGAEAPGGDGPAAAPLVRCRHFELRALRAVAPAEHRLDGRARVACVVAGGGRLETPGAPPRELRFGDTFLLPATLATLRLVPAPGGLELLEGIAA
jgi:hypothetical protein